MEKKIFIFVGLFFLLIIGGSYFLFLPKKAVDRVVLFVSETCPHCKNVEQFLDKNKDIKTQKKIEIKEISKQENLKDLEGLISSCKQSISNEIAVPLLYDKGDCLLGDQPIIDHLSSK